MKTFSLYLQEEWEYQQFVKWADGELDEAIIPPGLKRKFQFITDLAAKLKTNVKKLIQLFKNKNVFTFFQKINWDWNKLYKILRLGYEGHKKIIGAVGEFLHNTPVGKWTEEKLRELDKFLQNHPKLKRLTGVAVAAILAYIWFNMTFTGNPLYDFGMDDLIDAIAGNFTLSSIFAGPDGMKLLTLFATGVLGLSFPWPGPAKVQFAFAIIQTLARKVGIKLK